MLLHCDDVGPGPVVVLIHGFPFDRTMWRFQKGAIGSEYRVIAPDLRGHGRSAPLPGPYTVDGMANDVLETLDDLQIREPFVLGGLSLGGYVALSIAARSPQRLRGLILMDTRAAADAPDVAQGREAMARDVERTGDIGPVVRGMLPRLFAPASRERRAALISEVGDQMLRTPAVGVTATLRALASRPDRTADLAAIRVPTLVVCGADDVISPPDEMRRMADAIAGARFVKIPEAGHLAPLENPGPVDAAILEFLGAIADR
jgi:pimeloyl-ACP methyl ester carboxylesterase